MYGNGHIFECETHTLFSKKKDTRNISTTSNNSKENRYIQTKCLIHLQSHCADGTIPSNYELNQKNKKKQIQQSLKLKYATRKNIKYYGHTFNRRIKSYDRSFVAVAVRFFAFIYSKIQCTLSKIVSCIKLDK